MKKSTFFAVVLMLLVSVSAIAQSQDSDRSTPIVSNEVSANVSGDDTNQYFYSFVAGPGTSTITAEIKGVSAGQVVWYQLLEKNGADEISDGSDYVQATSAGNMARKITNVKLNKRRTILLRVTPQPLTGKLQYRIRLSGSAISDDSPKTDEKTSRPKSNDNPVSGKSGKLMKIPSKG
jgi:hypothetical protein